MHTEVTAKVAYVVDEWPSPTQTFVRDEVVELRRQGARIPVFALRRGNGVVASADDVVWLPDLVPSSALRRVLQLVRHPRQAVGVVRAQQRAGGERIPFRSGLPQVADQLRRSGIQWVHAHFGWEGAAVAEALAGMLGVGWSFTAHANDIFVANAHLAGRLRRADRLVTVCRYNEQELRARYATLPPIEIIVCGVEVPAVERHADDDGVDVLAVGRLVPKKGFDVLLRAVATMPASDGLRVELIGGGREADALDALARELGVIDRVHFVGQQPHEAVLRRMESARVVCLPARIAPDGDRDSMPVVLKEAMVRSVPVVATDVAGIGELVDDRVGRLVRPDDAGVLASALAEVLADADLAQRLGAAGRQRVLDRFTLTGEVTRLHRCFEQWSSTERP